MPAAVAAIATASANDRHLQARSGVAISPDLAATNEGHAFMSAAGRNVRTLNNPGEEVPSKCATRVDIGVFPSGFAVRFLTSQRHTRHCDMDTSQEREQWTHEEVVAGARQSLLAELEIEDSELGQA